MDTDNLVIQISAKCENEKVVGARDPLNPLTPTISINDALLDEDLDFDSIEFESLHPEESCNSFLQPFEGAGSLTDSEGRSSTKKLGKSLPSLIGEQKKNPNDKHYRRVNSRRMMGSIVGNNSANNSSLKLNKGSNYGSVEKERGENERVRDGQNRLHKTKTEKRAQRRKRSFTWGSDKLFTDVNYSVDNGQPSRSSPRGSRGSFATKSLCISEISENNSMESKDSSETSTEYLANKDEHERLSMEDDEATSSSTEDLCRILDQMETAYNVDTAITIEHKPPHDTHLASDDFGHEYNHEIKGMDMIANPNDEDSELALIESLVQEELEETFTTAKRARSLSPERTEAFHNINSIDKELFAERFPRAKKELDVKLKDFIAKARTHSKEDQELSKLMIVANEVLMSSSFNTLTTNVFQIAVEKVQNVLESAVDDNVTLNDYCKDLLWIISRPARLLECLEFDATEFYEKKNHKAEVRKRVLSESTRNSLHIPNFLVEKLAETDSSLPTSSRRKASAAELISAIADSESLNSTTPPRYRRNTNTDLVSFSVSTVLSNESPKARTASLLGPNRVKINPGGSLQAPVTDELAKIKRARFQTHRRRSGSTSDAISMAKEISKANLENKNRYDGFISANSDERDDSSQSQSQETLNFDPAFIRFGGKRPVKQDFEFMKPISRGAYG
eukprot:Nk52_evm32s255 gene=Nk52_evmTU32s255